MRPKSFTALTEAMGQALLTSWLREMGIDRETLRQFVEVGIPEEWLNAITGAFAPVVTAEDFPRVIKGPLHSSHVHNTLDSVDQRTTSIKKSRGRMAKTTLKSAAIQILQKRGVTITEFAAAVAGKAKHDVAYSTAASWFRRPGDISARRIPADCAQAALDLYGIPFDAWTGVIPPV